MIEKQYKETTYYYFYFFLKKKIVVIYGRKQDKGKIFWKSKARLILKSVLCFLFSIFYFHLILLFKTSFYW